MGEHPVESMTEHTAPEGYGHHWKEADRVQEFVQRMDHQAQERADVFKLMTGLAPYQRDATLRVLDIGAGYGAVAMAYLAEGSRL